MFCLSQMSHLHGMNYTPGCCKEKKSTSLEMYFSLYGKVTFLFVCEQLPPTVMAHDCLEKITFSKKEITVSPVRFFVSTSKEREVKAFLKLKVRGSLLLKEHCTSLVNSSLIWKYLSICDMKILHSFAWVPSFTWVLVSLEVSFIIKGWSTIENTGGEMTNWITDLHARRLGWGRNVEQQ